MNILLATPNYTIFIIGGALLLISILILIFFVLRKPKKSVSLDTTYFDQLLVALGGIDNIKDYSREHQRLQIRVENMKLVKALSLKELEIPAFVKGKQITLLIKHHTQEVLSFLDDTRKENN